MNYRTLAMGNITMNNTWFSDSTTATDGPGVIKYWRPRANGDPHLHFYGDPLVRMGTPKKNKL